MATFTVGPNSAVDITALPVSQIFNYHFFSYTTSYLRLYDDANNYTQFNGSITFNPVTQVVTSGELTGVEYMSGGNIVFTMTNLSYSAAQYYLLTATQPQDVIADVLSGNDTFQGAALSDVLYGYAGNDSINGGGGGDTMVGGLGNDVYTVDTVADRVYESAGEGSDTVRSAVTFSLLAGQEIEILQTTNTHGTGILNLSGNALGQRIYGNDGRNFINGAGGADSMYGYAGNDVYLVDNIADRCYECGGGGLDLIKASISYRIQEGTSVDWLQTNSTAGTATINLTGNANSNRIYGNAGNNVLAGREGNDFLNAFGGNDIFRFDTALGPSNVDTIYTYTIANDKIWLSSAIFTNLGPLAASNYLDSSAFVAGAAAQDADDRIIYNAANGQLLYDADGSGAGAAVLFAILPTALAMTAAEFQIV